MGIMKRNTSSIIGGGALMIQNGILSALLIITFISGLYDYNKLKKEEILDNNEAIDSALEKVDLEPKLDLNIKIDENNKIKKKKLKGKKLKGKKKKKKKKKKS